MDLDQRLHEAVLIQILESLTEQGFLRMLIWRGCGQHDLTEVVDTYNATYSGRGGHFSRSPRFRRSGIVSATAIYPAGMPIASLLPFPFICDRHRFGENEYRNPRRLKSIGVTQICISPPTPPQG